MYRQYDIANLKNMADEWVMANFTNATEILAVGYPQCMVRKRRTLMGAEGC